MLICDTHADTLYALQDRDRAQPLSITRERLLCTDDVRVQALALFTGPRGLDADPLLVRRQLTQFERLLSEGFHQITELTQAEAGLPNAMLTIEGGELFHRGEAAVEEYFEMGVRMAAIVWNHPNLLACPAKGSDPSGLTRLGRRVVGRMQRLGMAVDTSHLNEKGFWEIVKMDGPPPMASHSCARTLCDHPRNLNDEQLKGLFRAGGFVGVNFYPWFLSDSGRADVDTVVDHIEHICALGGVAHVGLGSDFDGIEVCPQGLTGPHEVAGLLERMRERGFDEKTVTAVAGENFAAYMRRVEALSEA